jgi:hypothetical protein
MLHAKYVNWFDEDLHTYYGDDNNGLIHGIYCYMDEDDFPFDVSWFKTEDEARKNLLKVGD